MSHETFETGVVSWACTPQGEQEDYHPQFSAVDLTKLVGVTEFRISANLSSSNWQHTQLFRTELSGEENPFFIKLEF